MIQTGQPIDVLDELIGEVDYHARKYHTSEDREVQAVIDAKLIRELRKREDLFAKGALPETKLSRTKLENVQRFLDGDEGKAWSIVTPTPLATTFR